MPRSAYRSCGTSHERHDSFQSYRASGNHAAKLFGIQVKMKGFRYFLLGVPAVERKAAKEGLYFP